MLKGYALVVGALVLALGVLGVLPHVPPNPVRPEYLLHMGTGVLFVTGGLILDEFGSLRSYVGGLGAMLVVAKVVLIVSTPHMGLSRLLIPSVSHVCLVIGVCSVLLALLIGIGIARSR